MGLGILPLYRSELPPDPPVQFGLRVEVLDASGNRLNDGPVLKVLTCRYSLALSAIGSYELLVPADDDKSAQLQVGRQVQIYIGGEGHVMSGLIDVAETVVDADNRAMLRIAGSSLGRQLVHKNTGIGFELDAVNIATCVDRLLSGTNWTAGQLGSPATVGVARFDGASRWAALDKVADIFHYHLRERPAEKRLDVDAFGTNPNGIVFQNVEAISPNLQDNTRLYPIAALTVLAESSDVWNSITPIGQRQGITGENLTLQNATRSVAAGDPYNVLSATGPDGLTYYYIEDSASVASYGRREQVIQVKDVLPLGLTATDFQNAANALYDRAVTELQRHKDAQSAYTVRVLGLKHLVNGVPWLQVGDKVRVVFRGVADDINGKRVWKSVDTSLYVMAFTRVLDADGRDEWQLTVSSTPREIANDGNLTAELLSQIHAVEAAPLPFVLFGNSQMRMDREGLQFQTPNPVVGGNLTESPALFWVNEFSDDPDGLSPRVRIAGASDPDTGTFPNGVFAYRLEAINGNRLARLRHVLVADGSAFHRMEFWHANSVDAVYYQQSYSPGTGKHYHKVSGGEYLESAIPMLFTTTGDPSTPAEGMVWYHAATATLRAYLNGTIVDLGASGMELIVKDADETVNNSTTLQDDDDLLFAVAANEKWQFEGVLFFDSSAVADIKFTFAGPAGAVGMFTLVFISAGANSQQELGAAQGASGSGVGVPLMVQFYGAIANDANAGSLKLQWAQNTADANDTKVHAGSYIKYQRQ